MKRHTLILAATAFSALSASAVTIVNVGDALGGRGSVDGWAGLYVDTRPISSGGVETMGTLTSIEFTARDRSAVVLTPLLFSNDGSSISVIGVGAAFSGYAAAGDYSESVTAVSGTFSFDTATAGVTYHQGMGMWNPDGNSRSADGLVDYDGSGGDWTAANEGETVAVGDIIGAPAGSNRIYSYQSNITFVPEPSGMFLVMVAGVFGLGRRRR